MNASAISWKHGQEKLKIYGEGEWKVRQHGYSKRRTWRKLHLSVYLRCKHASQHGLLPVAQQHGACHEVTVRTTIYNRSG